MKKGRLGEDVLFLFLIHKIRSLRPEEQKCRDQALQLAESTSFSHRSS